MIVYVYSNVFDTEVVEGTAAQCAIAILLRRFGEDYSTLRGKYLAAQHVINKLKAGENFRLGALQVRII